ncbi:lycopene cyclase family protein, partial [Arthrospira platensis SPKY1]|nr:lycopene cyclase family protein [Arthrospira platensis SPKY1]
LFSSQLLQEQVYRQEIEAYLLKNHGLDRGAYRIVEEEKGAIPMDDRLPAPCFGSIYQFGTLAGMTKASTGYTFARIQRAADAFVRSILENGLDADHEVGLWQGLSKLRYRLYDIALLEVLDKHPLRAVESFEQLFRKRG